MPSQASVITRRGGSRSFKDASCWREPITRHAFAADIQNHPREQFNALWSRRIDVADDSDTLAGNGLSAQPLPPRRKR